MGLSQAFLDEVRARTQLSALVGRSVKLSKAGREFKGCCPVHSEKTPSFTVNDAKGFAHCFGCGYHADAIRWLTDFAGLDFLDAVRELAAAAGLEMPAPSADAAEKARAVETVREALDTAQAIFVRQLAEAGAVAEYLAGRGLTPQLVSDFGVGYARGGDGSLRGSGIGEKVGQAAGLLRPRNDDPAQLAETFWDRVTIPIHDHRGALVGFGARVWPGRKGDTPKFLNSPDGPLFDKGATLFNLHRAVPHARPSAENRLLIVEGYFDVAALAGAGFHAAVAPMGTALTERQLERAWRVHQRPTLLFDGDSAGRRAARRACETALPSVGPGRGLAVALLPSGKDPDDLIRAGQALAIVAAVTEAQPLHAFLFDETVREIGAQGGNGPEATAGVWATLAALAETIADDDVRAEYLGTWRARYEREISAVQQLAAAEPLHSVTKAEDGDYAFPESESDSAARLIALVRALLKKREERRGINEEIKDLMAMAALAGFEKPALTAALKDIESDIAHGPAAREAAEMHRVLYRRVLGIRGPLDEAMLPQLVDARARQIGAGAKRRAARDALIDAQAVQV